MHDIPLSLFEAGQSSKYSLSLCLASCLSFSLSLSAVDIIRLGESPMLTGRQTCTWFGHWQVDMFRVIFDSNLSFPQAESKLQTNHSLSR